MEEYDRELLLNLVPSNPILRKLYDEHIDLERQLEKYEQNPPYSYNDSMKKKQLKKQKLRGMDTILAILNEHKRGDPIVQAGA